MLFFGVFLRETARPGGVGGGLGGHTFKLWGSCQTAGPIGTKFSTRLWIHLGMDIGSNN